METKLGIASAPKQIPREVVSASDWDGVVRVSPDGWTFALYGWQELILQVDQWGLQDHSFALQENGRLVAVVPLQFNPNNGTMASSGWGGVGPVLVAGLAPKARRRIMDAALLLSAEMAQRAGAASFEITLMPVTQTSLAATWGVNPLALHGFEDTSGLSQIIDLRVSAELLWEGLSSDARRQIRLAQEAGYHVEQVDWLRSLDHYYALHCETYRRTGASPHPKAYFAGIASHIASMGHAALWCVRDKDGTVVGYHNDSWFGEAAYYHTGCSATGSAASGAGYLLFWEAMIGARAAGIKWYDCGAIFPNAGEDKQRGLTTFKTKFGGEAHRLFRGRKSLHVSSDSAIGPDKPGSGRIRQHLRHAGQLLLGRQSR
ncbi:hypothetical protein XM25_18785 [Devosia sp. H5989]|nr:hypothetical protein XM25_18785 [Devosia sp. H5989]